MEFLHLVIQNILNFPLFCFLFGFFFFRLKPEFRLPPCLNKWLTVYILFSIGLKGGGPLLEHSSFSDSSFFLILGSLIFWGLLTPFFAYYLLRVFTHVDRLTAAAIGASFGSVSVMTFVGAISFLDQLNVDYQKLIIAILSIMEIPAIISGVLIAKAASDENGNFPRSSKTFELLRKALFNKAVIGIVIGLLTGAILHSIHFDQASSRILFFFKPLLCLFLFDMGLKVSSQKEHFSLFSWRLNFFGLYMPLIGGSFGLVLSYILGLNVGTGTLVAVLTASASYIAVPAAMRIVLPEAKEAIYLPLSLGIAFPFNMIIGIPLYYYLALNFLKSS